MVSYASSAVDTPMVSKMERTLLGWCRQSVTGCDFSETVLNSLSNDISVENFTSSFSDGKAFCAILKRYHPDLVDNTLLSRLVDDPTRLLDFVFRQFEKIGIPRLLDPEDFENDVRSGGVDKKSVMTYVMCIFRKLHVPVGGGGNIGIDTSHAPSDDTTTLSYKQNSTSQGNLNRVLIETISMSLYFVAQ